ALGDGGVTLALRKGGGEEGSGVPPHGRALGESARGRRALESSYQLVGMRFVGANPRPEVAGEGLLEGKVNYFVGRDASKWRAGVRTFSGVRYRDLYKGVDLVFHGGPAGTRLEYDFVLAPGADPGDVRLGFDGADRLSLGRGGELLVHTGAGTITQSAPVIYQQVGGVRREVAGGYVLRGRREVGFRLGRYDPASALVIDPVLAYSTYFPNADSMEVDASGNVYASGTALSFYGDYPVTPGAFQQTSGGLSDVFVAKFNAAGDGFAYLTYLGGSGSPQVGLDEEEQGLAIDAAGNAYVTGRTFSADFPVANAFQPARGGSYDAFVTKLNATGSALVYSTYLGGEFMESGGSIAVDAAGAAYVLGGTDSVDFPVRNALQAAKRGSDDFFITKFAPDGKSLEYSTYLGGSGYELGYISEISVDAAGAAYVGGSTDSPDYPVTPGAYQQTAKTDHGDILAEALVTKIAPGGASLVYSTYLGGSKWDYVYGLAVDEAGQAHVVGDTRSPDFPTQNALSPTARDPFGNGFISKLNAAGTALVYSTYLGGTPRPCGTRTVLNPDACDGERAFGVATDAAGNAYVTGNTISGDFPPAAALQPNLKGYSDAYVLKFSPAGQALWATYLGGSSYDSGTDIEVDSAGGVYLLGYAASDDFPTVNPHRDDFRRKNTEPFSAFLARLSEAAVPAATSRVRFDSAAYTVGESGRSVRVNVTRSGDLSQGVAVDYSTGDLTALERADYTTARGTLSFAPGEASKGFDVSVTDDRTVEGDESLTVALHNLRGAAVLDSPASARLDIIDDDEHPGTSNPVDSSEFFVRQHYLDFLSREPDADGLAFWTDEIEKCGADAQCREVRRVNVSAAFFLSIEFQETGFLVERIYRLAFGESVPYRSFVREAREVGGGVVVGQGDWRQRLDANRRAYAEEFTTRTAFREEFPESLTPAQYVERLNAKASGALSPAEFNALVVGLEAGTETRGSVLLKVADDEDFRRREFAPAFVLMQYLGYLRRDPDEPGYQFWLNKLHQFNGDFIRAEMVKAFVNSDEYRRRFLEPQKEAAFGTPFTLGLGETAIVRPDNLRVRILSVGPDSRCPRGVQCVHAGSISILLEAVTPGGDIDRFDLSIIGQAPRPFPGNTPVSRLGYTFRLLQADPEPPYPNPRPPFQALLQIDKP
ncbi:MAG TPA: SBBP repeat-containing protein, partial [Pyrinomonadaceae bacterium]